MLDLRKKYSLSFHFGLYWRKLLTTRNIPNHIGINISKYGLFFTSLGRLIQASLENSKPPC